MFFFFISFAIVLVYMHITTVTVEFYYYIKLYTIYYNIHEIKKITGIFSIKKAIKKIWVITLSDR